MTIITKNHFLLSIRSPASFQSYDPLPLKPLWIRPDESTAHHLWSPAPDRRKPIMRWISPTLQHYGVRADTKFGSAQCKSPFTFIIFPVLYILILKSQTHREVGAESHGSPPEIAWLPGRWGVFRFILFSLHTTIHFRAGRWQSR